MEIKDDKSGIASTEMPAAPSKRPWRLSAIEMVVPKCMGIDKCTAWTPSVVDANGLLVCFGRGEDMRLIVDAVNQFQSKMEEEIQ